MSRSDANPSEQIDRDIFGEQEAGTQLTPGDRVLRVLDTYVYAPFRIAWNDWRMRIGSMILLFYVLMGTVGVVIIPQPQFNQAPRLIGPFQSLAHPLGTDGLGQDMLQLIVHSTPAMLKMILAGGIFSSGVGVLIGLVAGYKSGTLDYALMTLTDVVMTIPGLPLVLFISAIFPPEDPFLVGVLLAVDGWPGLARNLRSEVLSLREESYIEAARAQGIPPSRILTHEIFPKIAPYTIINASGAAVGVISASVGLYFLGLLPFTTLNWGVIMNLARQNGALANPSVAGHWLFVPAATLAILSFGFTLFSQGTDRIFNPRLRARHSETVVDEDEEEPTSPMN